MEIETTKENNTSSLCNFLGKVSDEESITESIDNSNEEQQTELQKQTKTITVNKKTNYWISDKVKAHRKEYARKYYKRKKQQQETLIEDLKSKQIIGTKIAILNVSGKEAIRNINSEQEYIKLLDDLLFTLKANKIINDYLISEPDPVNTSQE